MKKQRVLINIAAMLLTAILALSVFGGCTQARSGKDVIVEKTTTEQSQETATGQAEKTIDGQTQQKKEDQTKPSDIDEPENQITEDEITEDGEYYSKEDVAEYLYLYEHLPDNYITKNEAKDLGWVSSKGNLWDVAPGKVIGGDTFGNREGLLPKKNSRKYYECDVNYEGGFRGSDRIIYSNDGLIYFTEDHYNTFELLYGEED